MNFKPFLLAIPMLVLTGCMTSREPVVTKSVDEGIYDRLNEATESAVKAQRELASAAEARAMQRAMMRQRLFTDVADYDFYGDVETIANQLAVKYGYEFRVYGKRPPEGVNVNIYLTKKPVIEVLKQIGLTSNAVLDITLKSDSIELLYKQP